MSLNDELFEKIALDLMNTGVSVSKNGVPETIAKNLQKCSQNLLFDQFKPAAVGRGGDQLTDSRIRRDDIYWIDSKSKAEVAWLNWMAELQSYLSRRLYLGLFSFESHFSHYSPGDFYGKHCDAFKGQRNRILSVVTYLNDDWKTEDAGELLIYDDIDNSASEQLLHTVLPEMRTLVVFLSEQFPHEVLAANKDRYSIAGWFRVNGSGKDTIDPPR